MAVVVKGMFSGTGATAKPPAGGGTPGAVAFWTAAQVLGADGANFYWDNLGKNLGIGTNNPVFDIELQRDGGNVDIFGTSFTGATASGTQLTMRMARGSVAVPTALLLNDRIGSFGFRGYDGATFGIAKAIINVFASENWTGAAQGTVMVFENTLTGTVVRSEGARLDGAGLFSAKAFGINGGAAGVTGNFTTADGKTVNTVNGIVTSIV